MKNIYSMSSLSESEVERIFEESIIKPTLFKASLPNELNLDQGVELYSVLPGISGSEDLLRLRNYRPQKKRKILEETLLKVTDLMAKSDKHTAKILVDNWDDFISSFSLAYGTR